jgi:DNA-binding NtrC family response regulator
VVPDGTLSREHGRFELLEDGVWVTDLASTNGTTLNGEQVERGRLRPEDEVRMGRVRITLHAIGPRDTLLQGLERHDRFQSLLEEEMVRVRTFGRKMSLLMVGTSTEEASESGGVFPRIYPQLRKLLRAVDRVGIFSPAVLEILLPEADLEQATRLARSIIEMRQAADPLMLCGAAVFPDAATSAEELVEVSRRALLRAGPAEPILAVGLQDPRAAATSPSGATAEEPLFLGEAMREVLSSVDRIARSTLPVLISGETGTGKEVLARMIHARGGRRDRPILCVNCGAIPETLIGSVLFGHERGAFTGADRARKGIFEEASGGTVLLDEIGELSMPAQVSLLRVLETKRVARVGSTRELEVDTRILAATNRDLMEMCAAGTFRSDLFFRINTVVLPIPPLRERRDEIQALAEHFVRLACRANCCGPKALHPRALELLLAHHWPGNVRELRNVIERAVVIATGDTITEEELPERLRCQPAARCSAPGGRHRRMTQSVASARIDQTNPFPSEAPPDSMLARNVQAFEIHLILQALQTTDGNQPTATRRGPLSSCGYRDGP